jgi:hypothetical protein
MSLHGTLPCWCCGEMESTTDCVRGHRCDCGPGLYAEHQCQLCRFCPRHCQCSDAMKVEHANIRHAIDRLYREVRDRYSQVVNRGQGLPAERRRQY